MWLPVDNQVLSPMSARTQPQANLNYKGIYSLNKGKRGEKVRILKTPQKPRFKKKTVYMVPLVQNDLFATHDFVGTPHVELPSSLWLMVPN